jgi:hypothetical protein
MTSSASPFHEVGVVAREDQLALLFGGPDPGHDVLHDLTVEVFLGLGDDQRHAGLRQKYPKQRRRLLPSRGRTERNEQPWSTGAGIRTIRATANRHPQAPATQRTPHDWSSGSRT